MQNVYFYDNVMKNLLLLLSIVCCISACSSPEKGSLDRSILSKKVFDAVKTGDADKFRLLIPNREPYERYFHLKQLEPSTFDSTYTAMRDSLLVHFNQFTVSYDQWDAAVYANTQEMEEKSENITEALITTKFKVGEDVKKYSFNANKLNGRWYVTGDFEWVK